MSKVYQDIVRSIDWIVAHWEGQPSLEVMAAQAGMPAGVFQKQFTAYVGVSPKRFVQSLTYGHARDLLVGGMSTLDAAYASGLSGNGRLHDLCVTIEAATPGEIKACGLGLRIVYGVSDSPFGQLIVARSPRGICYLGFLVDESEAVCVQRIFVKWPKAEFVRDDAAIADDANRVIEICMGRGRDSLSLHLFGTNFQMAVWQALLRIPSRHFVSYEGLGAAIGRAQSPRAIGNAVGANPVSLLIPCHRVIQKSGVLNNYGWGSARKKALLAIECCDTIDS
jgi:AraC family transcriptional regulator of adaptative response/methylated-DNA-[protein]-cysteine methyltransferase